MEKPRPNAEAAGHDTPYEGGEYWPAFADAVDRSDWETATFVVRNRWFDLLRDHGTGIRSMFSAVSARELRAHPLLVLLVGLSYNTHGVLGAHRLSALRYFSLAVRAAERMNHELAPLDQALIRAAEAVAHRLRGQPKQGVTAAHSALRALHEIPLEDRTSTPYLARVYGQVGITLFYGGDVEGALDAFAAGLSELPFSSDPGAAFGCLSMLAGIQALRGYLPESTEYVENARSSAWVDAQRNSYIGTFYRLAEAILALHRFDAHVAREHLAAIESDERTTEHWTAIAHVEALVSLVEGTPGRGLARLDILMERRGSEGRSPASRAALAQTRALLHLAVGNPLAAKTALQHRRVDDAENRVAGARVALAQDHTGSALSALRSIAGEYLPARVSAEAAALEAAIILRISTAVKARPVLDHLGNILERTGQLLPLALLPEPHHSKVVEALRDIGYGPLLSGASIRSVFPQPRPEQPLTHRELAILEIITAETTVADIGSRLSISPNTVKTHLRNLYRKLGVSNREDAVAIAIKRYLFIRRE